MASKNNIKTKVIILRSTEINPDPRVQKYVNFLENKGIKYKIIGWDRIGNKSDNANITYYGRRAEYGRKYKNIINKIFWFSFIIRYLIKNRNNYGVVHACDFDTALPAYISKLVTKKEFIFDVFDWIGNADSKGLQKLIHILQTIIAKKSKAIIICEEFRKHQLGFDSDKIYILPNIPDCEYKRNLSIINKIKSQRDKYKIILSYVGVYDENRGLEDVLKIVSENKSICLNIGGFGRLSTIIDNYARNNSNIVNWGKVSYCDALNIMKESDAIIALYYLTNPVHKYAAPNKYYEGLLLGKPIITTKGTLIGNNTLKYDTGFAIDEGLESIYKLLSENDLKDKIIQKGINSRFLWESKFLGYVDNFMENQYYKIISDSKKM